MGRPKGKLSASQYEIVEAIWEKGSKGATVAEIWEAIAKGRDVSRTTVLNLVTRLEKRGWLLRAAESRPQRYKVALNRKQTAALLANEFVNDFFGGSASQLVMSLLGSKKLKDDEIERLQQEVKSKSRKRKAPKKI